jgi:hypothetical protein
MEELKEGAVPNHEELETTAVDAAALFGESQQRRIDEQFLVAVGFRGAGLRYRGPLLEFEVVTDSKSDVANVA